ncbi:MAG: agmatinase [archaeon]
MIDSIINCDNISAADVVLLAANYDRTSSFGKGADKGPQAIKRCLDGQLELYDPYTGTTPTQLYKIAYHDLGDLNYLRPEEMVRKVAEEFKKLYCAGKFVVSLGGEHSISIAPFRVLAEKNPQEVTVLQIDAHADLRDDDSDYADEPHGKYAHCCVMRRAHELGLKTVQVGIRAYSGEEQAFMKGMTVFKWNQERLPAVEEIIEAITTENVYLTLDVDGIDPAHMPATGTPVQGGLSWQYTLNLLYRLACQKNVLAADIVEVAPRSTDALTEYGAAQLCYNLIAWNMPHILPDARQECKHSYAR